MRSFAHLRGCTQDDTRPRTALRGYGAPLHGSFRVRSQEDAAARDLVIAFEDNFHGFGVNAVLLLQNARAERVFGVSVLDRHDGLQDDRAGVEIFIHKVNRAASEFYSVFERLALGFEAREGREKRGVNIENALGKGGDKVGGKQAHVTGEADEVDAGFVEDGGDLAIVGFALEALGRQDFCGDAARFGAFDAGSAFAIADDNRDFRVGDAAGSDAIGKGFKIRAAAAQEHANALLHKQKTLAQAVDTHQTRAGKYTVEC